MIAVVLPNEKCPSTSRITFRRHESGLYCCSRIGLRDEAAEFIDASGLREQLRELATLNSNALREAESSGRPSIAILNRPELIHLAMLIDDPELHIVAHFVNHITHYSHVLSSIWHLEDLFVHTCSVGRWI